MRNISAMGLGLVGGLLILLSLVAASCALSVEIRPFSWHLYWRTTADEWYIALICLPISFSIFRHATRICPPN